MITPATLAQIANVLGAQPRGGGSWFAAGCPVCGAEWSLSITRRGAECRADACRWSTCDLRTVVARWMVKAGRSRTEIVSALRLVA